MSKPAKKTKTSAPVAAEPSALKLAFLGWYGVVGMTLGYVSPIKLPWADGYAKDHWRHALGSLLIVLALLASGVGLALYLVDVNDFKDQIVAYVKTHKQRDLVLEGDIHINWFPQLGLDTGRMSLSQRNSGRKFASVENARLYVAWWPLLTKQVQVERVVLDGLHANLVRHPDGSTNFDDLLTPADWMGEVQFEIDKVRVLESSLNFQDEGSDQTLLLHDLNLETGRLADGTAGQVDTRFRLQSTRPQLDLQVHVNGHVLYQHAIQRYEVADMEGQARGEAAGLSDLVLDWRGSLATQPAAQQFALDKFSGNAKGRIDQRAFEARLSAASLKRDKQQWHGSAVSAGLSLQQDKDLLSASVDLPVLDADEKTLRSDKLQLALDLFPGEMALQGKFSSPLNVDLATRQLQLAAVDGGWTLAHPLLAGKLNGSTNGQLQANWPAQDVKFTFKTKVDDSTLDGSVQLQDFKTPAWTFDLAANVLDLDRYLVTDWVQRLQTAALAADLNAMQALDIKGKLRSDELRAARLKASQFAAELRAAGGVLNVEPLQARLYGGNLQGSATLKAGAEAPQFNLRQNLNGVQAEALLADLQGGDTRLSGKGNLALELSAQGRTPEALRQSLAGTASVTLAHGSMAGLNLGEALLAGKEQLGLDNAVRNDSVRLTESTPFNELKASVEFAQGQARSNDLLLKAAHYSAKGDGSYALESGLLDGWLSATVAPGLKRSAGELAELSGISVPLQVSGPWTTAALSYKLGEASGGNLARLAKANQARVAAAAAPHTPPAASAPAAALTRTTAVVGSKPAAR
jgi:AsmA protein